MSLKEVDGLPGAPWDRELLGNFEKLTVESELLAGNPLGDPTRRPLYVYTPPGVSASETYPSVYLIQGMTGQLDMWLGRSAFEQNIVERVDEMFSDESVPRAIVVFVDAWTSLGGSQFINSTATGRYMDYLCDEVVPFIDSRYPTDAEPGRRGITGKSSGGYGAMVVPMMRPDVFGALASHAGRCALRGLLPARVPDGGPVAQRSLRGVLRGVLGGHEGRRSLRLQPLR